MLTPSPSTRNRLVLDYPKPGTRPSSGRSVAHNGSACPHPANLDVPEYNLPPQAEPSGNVGWHLAHRHVRDEQPSDMAHPNESQPPGVRQRSRSKRPCLLTACASDNTHNRWTAASFTALPTPVDGRASTAAAHMAMAAGQKWRLSAASGNPSRKIGPTRTCLISARLCAQYASVVGIAVHEYSWRTDDIRHGTAVCRPFEDIRHLSVAAASRPTPPLP